jgi:hypothetical protein
MVQLDLLVDPLVQLDQQEVPLAHKVPLAQLALLALTAILALLAQLVHRD